MTKTNVSLVLLFLLLSVAVTRAASYPVVVDDHYSGGFKDDFPAILSRVKTLAPLTQQDIATRLGLTQPSAVFMHPVTIRFDDGAPALHENPFFYILPGPADQPSSQQLIANVEAFAHHSHETAHDDHGVRNAFNYAMTELILNDLTGGPQASGLSLWTKEGLGIYFSDQGPHLVKELADTVPQSKVRELVGDLNRTPTYIGKSDYVQYYLAIQYISDTHGLDTLQQFIRELIGGKSPAEAVLDTMSQEWPAFEKEVQAYSYKTLAALAPADNDPRFQSGVPVRRGPQ